MKLKKIVALLSILFIPTAFSYELKGDESTIEIRGRIEGRANYAEDNESSSHIDDRSRARISLLGKTTINDSTLGFAKFETQFSNNNTVDNRYYYAGLDTQYGRFSYGKQDTAITELADITDIMLSFSPQSIAILDGSKKRQENTVLWSKKSDRWMFNVDYVFSDKKTDNDSIASSVLFKINEPFLIGLGGVYEVKSEQYQGVLSLSYNTKKIDFGLNQSFVNKKDKEYYGVEVSALYHYDSMNKIAMLYDYGDYSHDSAKYNHLSIEFVHRFNKAFRTYVGYRYQWNSNKANDVNFGLRYDFK
ncbi:porin [Photobacterium damselae]|uniref:porin n=1 Tax=Photobacterium damselae TaxID=38293 RepID=UPI004068F3FC